MRKAVTRVLKNDIALAVANLITLRFANRQRRRRPGRTGILIANVNHFAGRIADRIIGPRRDSVLVTGERPGGTRAGFSNHESKVGIVRYHVGPRCRRPLPFAEHDYVLTTARRKPAHPITTR